MTSHFGRRRARIERRRARRVPVRPSKTGAVGICASCGKQVLPRYIDERKQHTAIVTYGRNRVRCGGNVIPLSRGALDP